MVDAILRCPKCHAGMMSFRRDGVAIDQCGACRGVFLDEGALSRLIDSPGAPPPVVPPPPNGYPKPVYEGRHRRD
jgi:Zn-finger nucleic acid-binding protein